MIDKTHKNSCQNCGLIIEKKVKEFKETNCKICNTEEIFKTKEEIKQHKTTNLHLLKIEFIKNIKKDNEELFYKLINEYNTIKLEK